MMRKVTFALVVKAALLQSLQLWQVSGQTCTIDEVANDPCPYVADGECDAGIFCDAGTDCFDCDPSFLLQDPCFALSSTDCGTCIGSTDADGNACEWCPHWNNTFAFCLSPTLAESIPQTCEVSPGYVSNCPATCDAPYANQTYCSLSFNRICDIGPSVYYGSTEISGLCGVDTDCMDCDPCHEYDSTDCETCTTNGCVWCSKDAACWSPHLALLDTETASNNINPLQGRTIETFSCTLEDLAANADQCATLDADNFFVDPLYDANTWVFDSINVLPAWEAGFTGAGIGIRINDNGVDITHPDFSGKFDVDSSCEIFQPSPPTPEEDFSHGTVCAAIAAASANDACSVGIAPDATISSCAVISTDNPSPERSGNSFLFAKMETMDVSNNSWGSTPCQTATRRGRRLQGGDCPFLPDALPCLSTSACAGTSWGIPGSQSFDCEQEIIRYCRNSFDFEADEAGCIEFLDLFADCNYIVDEAEQEFIVQGVTQGRQGRGIVYVFAAGNDYDRGENTNQHGNTHNTRLVINVGAVGKDNVVSTYSARGTGLLVVGPGGDDEFWSNHVVATNSGGCKDAGVGTSYAAPVVSGVVALMLQANGNLTYRDVQGIVATTSTRVNPTDSSWVTNAAGISHSDEYGFGLINAGDAVKSAQTWELYSAERMATASSGQVNMTIPEFTPQSDPVASTVTMNGANGFTIESVYLYLKLKHSSRGDLQITLTSPSGTVSIVHPWGRPENGQSVGFWKFTSWKYFGERPAGDWTLSIEDQSSGDLSACVDDSEFFFPFSNSDGTVTEVDCNLLDRLQFCQDGATEIGGVGVDGADDPFLQSADGQTPLDACCSCGGGVSASTVPDILEEWYVVAYGHSSGDAPIPPPSSTNAPALVPPGLGGTNAPTLMPSGPTPSCDPQLETLSQCIAEQSCAECLNDALTSVTDNEEATCGLFQSSMCQAIQQDCDTCSSCVVEAEEFYECLATNVYECPSFLCSAVEESPTSSPADRCDVELETVARCVTQPCANCLDSAYGSVFGTADSASCVSFENIMCRAISDCDMCSGCTVEAEDYYRCLSSDGCDAFQCPTMSPTAFPTVAPSLPPPTPEPSGATHVGTAIVKGLVAACLILACISPYR